MINESTKFFHKTQIIQTKECVDANKRLMAPVPVQPELSGCISWCNSEAQCDVAARSIRLSPDSATGEDSSFGTEMLSVESHTGSVCGVRTEVTNRRRTDGGSGIALTVRKHVQKDGWLYCTIFYGPDQFLNYMLIDYFKLRLQERVGGFL